MHPHANEASPRAGLPGGQSTASFASSMLGSFSGSGVFSSFASHSSEYAAGRHPRESASRRLSVTELLHLPVMSARNPTRVSIWAFLRHALHPSRLANPVRDEKRKQVRVFTKADFAVILFTSMAYFFSVSGFSYIGILAPSLEADALMQYSPAAHANLVVTLNTISAFGKLTMGFLNDLTNPRFMLGTDYALSAMFILLFSLVHQLQPAYSSSQISFMIAMAGLNSLMQSGTWSATIKWIHDHYRPAQWGKAITVLAVCSRLGAVLTALALGSVIKAGYSWTLAAQLCAFLVFMANAPLLLTFCFPHPAGHLAADSEEDYLATKHRFDAKALPSSMIKKLHHPCDAREAEKDVKGLVHAVEHWMGWWVKRQFITVAVCQASMAVLGFGLLDFIPLITVNALGGDKSSASYVSVGLPLGMAVSNLIGFFYIETLSGPSKANLVLVFLSLVCLMALVFVIVAAVAASQGNYIENATPGFGILTFFIGLFLGYPYYAPMTSFAMHWGGPSHAALATSSLQLFSGIVTVIFDALVGAITSSGGNWVGVAVLVLGFAVLAFMTMAMFYHEELNIKKREMGRLVNEQVALRIDAPHNGDPPTSTIPGVVPEDQPLSDETRMLESEKLSEFAHGPHRRDNHHRVRKEVAIVAAVTLFAFAIVVFSCYVAWRENGSTNFFFSDQGISTVGGSH